jgi:uncharacterized protein (DUF1501 family)
MSRIHFNKRRDFLKGAACMAASGAASTFVPQLSMMGTALAQSAPSGYKALVCIYLSGGNDSWNLLIPGDNSTQIPDPRGQRVPLAGQAPTPYGWYVTSRGGIYSGNSSALGLLRPGSAEQAAPFLPPALGILGNQYGLNPAVPELQQLFNQGKLAFIANAGPLVEPLRRSTLRDFRRPPQLYSHNDQTSLWQLGGGSDSGAPNGWGGRLAARLLGVPPANGLAPCISISGQSRFLVGQYPNGQPLTPYRVSTNATSPSVSLSNYSSNNPSGNARREALQEMLDATYPQAMSNAYGDILDRSLDLALGVNTAIGGLTATGSPYAAFMTAVNAIPDTNIGRQLRQVARMIAVSRFGQGSIQANRQIFYVSTGGYDTHGGQINGSRPNGSGVWAGHQGLLQQVAQAMAAFDNAMEVLNGVAGYSGVRNEVVSFTMSEFARTINSNGAGTDHAWGGVQMVMGAAVQGSQVYGRYPLQMLNRSYVSTPDQFGECFNRGEFIPTTAVEQMSATLARWMGVSDADLPLIFPNIGNFTNGSHPNASVLAYNTRTLPFLSV